MKPFKKRGFWFLFGFVVLVGAFLIVDFGLKNQSPVIPNVDAQVTGSDFGSSARGTEFGGMMPQNVLFSRNPSSGVQSDALLSPSDVMFGLGMHPGSYMFYQYAFPADVMFPGNVIFPGDTITRESKGKTEMRTILTCVGCTQTMSTCDWDCGPTFSYCSNTGNIYGSSFTGLTCPGPTGLICGGVGNTNLACTNSFCSGGGYTTLTCRSGGIFCAVGGGATAHTCDVFSCRASGAFPGASAYPGIGISSITCGGFLYSGCGGQWDGIYSWSISSAPTTPPSF